MRPCIRFQRPTAEAWILRAGYGQGRGSRSSSSHRPLAALGADLGLHAHHSAGAAGRGTLGLDLHSAVIALAGRIGPDSPGQADTQERHRGQS